MIPVLFGAAYTALLLAIIYFLIERLIHQAQNKPILIQVAGPVRLRPVEIAGNGQSLTEFAAAIAFAIVEGTAKIAVAKGKQ